MGQFREKVVIITGASSGIGLAAAKEFAKEGAYLVVAARRGDKLNELLNELNNRDNHLAVVCDVTVESDCKELVDKTVERYGRVDILINNAGISMRALFNDLQLDAFQRVMDVNFYGTVNCTKYALPHILKADGSIVGVISIAGYKGLPARSAYSASKFAIYGFLETLRVEYLREKLHVMIFAPGFTSSNIREKALTADGSAQGETPRDEGKMMSAEECAKHLLRGVRRRRREVILTPVGKTLVLLNKFFPRLVDRLEYNYMRKEPGSPFK